jgi:putative DNA primase/helicase
LAGVRFTNISEPGRGLVLNAAQVKSMTGNDTLNARFLHENSFDFKPQFKLYINTNYLPVINDMTLFSSGRVVIIPFDRHFEESEQDRTLKSEFAKAKNQSAILNWLVEGYRLAMQEGLMQPAAVIAATAEYKQDSDKVMQFVEEKLEAAPMAETRTSVVYEAYRGWCSENGCYAENMRNFNQALRSIATVTRKRPATGGGATTLLCGYRISGAAQPL